MLQQRLYTLLQVGSARYITTSKSLDLNQKWRRDRGLPLNPTACGVLVDGADYTFLDGRLTPYGMGQKKRILQQRGLLEQIVDLTGEIDFAVERHKQSLLEEENRRRKILENKLKPKGLKLLKSK